MIIRVVISFIVLGFGICIDMDYEVIEDDDDINLESFGNEFDDNDN